MKRGHVWSVAFLLVPGCGGGAPPNPNGTNLAEVIADNPDTSPLALDSANDSSSSSFQVRAPQFGIPGGGLELRVEKAAGSDANFGLIRTWQCRGSALMAYLTIDTQLNESTQTYAGTVKYRDAEGGFGTFKNTDVISHVTTAGVGTLELHNLESALGLTFSSAPDGKNTLASSDGWRFVWDESGLGCVEEMGGVTQGFSYTTNPTTLQKTLSASSDMTLCASLPEFATYQAPGSLEGDEVWDCMKPGTATELSVGSAPDLEDAGGPDCVMDTSFWGTASVAPDSCGTDETTMVDVTCRLEAYYAIATQASKQIKRQFACKLEGIAEKSAAGEIEGFSAVQTEAAHLFMSLGF